MRHTLSRLVGWLADRRVPRFLRRPVYGAYCAFTGADASEAERPLADYPSLGAFFVRRLRPGARPLDPATDALLSPCDGTVQTLGVVEGGMLLQAKGRAYPLTELLARAAEPAALEGGRFWTIYLSPRDYHRIHAPFAARLTEVRRVPGEHYSVAPKVLSRRARVLSVNERAVLRLETTPGPCFLVMVGAQNVSRIGVEGEDVAPSDPRSFARGDELARFEMGSTVVLITPPGFAEPPDGLAPGDGLRLGQRIGSLSATPPATESATPPRDPVSA
jgi:phosphatidylserine decarboxylase